MSISVSVLTLMAISIERYQAIVHPLKFTGTKHRARILILSVWILSLLLVLPDAFMMTLNRQFADQLHIQYLIYCEWDSHPLTDLLYQLHISLCLFVIPLCFMVYAYTGIARALWSSLPSERIFNDDKCRIHANQLIFSDKSNRSSLRNSTKSANLVVQENRQKAAKMLISVVIIFAICYIPVHAFNLFRYITVYLEHITNSQANDTSDGNNQCVEPKRLYLERTGAANIVTISALISHFLPYFNSSINPTIYNIMSDKFRIKFRELFLSRCCCCCKPIPRMKSASSIMMQFKPSGLVQNSLMTLNSNRSSVKNNYRQSSTNTINIGSGGGPIKTNSNNNNNNTKMTNHNGINAYTHNRPICFRLTNV
ncbi:unnamed protein product [Rotaria magnacalcarata]|uniref:G-protein coupled receptors family 1 profile domain-containing protein n=4 Tax=Rotaria magnacalcarata TaxID=392030 RepID=A0A815ZXA3_9BILA|nr:unnamed protein product [Rotaria magnacalcarata]CAF1683096.1 unnamed protein product [Rotaria magnacalcarata]CAF2027580.1 unnamed protein product [Rotaria magnacalcarata]CAF2055368.1 unnamed protein product [Rotaria magnacalcarata]CAF2145867.1 unnamed protein product [Rotaria magnacalcarata]